MNVSGPNDDDRKRRLRDLESKIRDPRSIINVDCLLDAVQSLVADCDHTAIRKIKNVDAFVSRCKYSNHLNTGFIRILDSQGDRFSNG